LATPAPAHTAERDAMLLVTVGDDDTPTIAMLSNDALRWRNEETAELTLYGDTRARQNLQRRGLALVWFVLDGAAYSVGFAVERSTPRAEDDTSAFVLRVDGVWRDFNADAPLTAGPRYRASPQDSV
jgi:hypothetical protein